jgi:hypothetical protein
MSLFALFMRCLFLLLRDVCESPGAISGPAERFACCQTCGGTSAIPFGRTARGAHEIQ